MQNDNGEQTCVLILSADLGVCNRPMHHPIHQMLGITPVEHKFERERSGVMEQMKLSRRNIKRIAKRSGQNPGDLERMRKLLLLKKAGMVITYDVLPEIVAAEKEK